MFYFSIQHYYCIAFIAGKSLKNHWEPRCTEMKITLSSIQHTFSVPEKLPYLSWNCKIRTPPISRTSLLPPLQECYLTAVTIFSLIPWYWKLGSPWCHPLLSNASAQIRGSPSLSFAKGKVKRGALSYIGFIQVLKLKNIWHLYYCGPMPSFVSEQF